MIGCVDGSFVASRSEQKAPLWLREGYFALNVMFICVTDMSILAMDPLRPGLDDGSHICVCNDATPAGATRIARGLRRSAWRFPAVAARIAAALASGFLAERAFGGGQEMPQQRRHKPGAERLSRDARRSLGSGRERHGALGGRQNPSGEARPARALSTLAPPPQQHSGRPGDAPGMPRRKQHRPQRMQCECMPQTAAKPMVWTPKAASVRVPVVRASRGVCPGRAPAPAAGPRAQPRARSAPQ
ncbi:hypothetical protein HPB51_001859 [Rhipicephalus microplus]|uniref:Uncharacterized protein n=1 Tax=Rhipicephalus microplus TaxID=6941 RepID=A0A9J6D8G3_RHIMP|nr:hypothetical protein HPB51_001859 [Rhipicephalus microplus]